MNYHELGDADGFWGGKTRGAITAFMNDRGQPTDGTITPAVTAEINKAIAEKWSRPIAPSRANATAKDIAPKVEAVRQSLWQQFWAKIGAGFAAIGLTGSSLSSAFDGVRDKFESVHGYLAKVPPELWFVIFGQGLQHREAELMLTDLFWNMATSNVVLIAIGVVAIAALIVGHVPFGKYAPVIGPYVVLAQFVAYPTLMLLAFLIGVRISDERAETERLKNDLAFKEQQIENVEATAQDAEQLKAEAEAKANDAKGQLDAFREKYGDHPEATCAWTDDDLSRLRALQRAKP
jgi:hypothetical protein